MLKSAKGLAGAGWGVFFSRCKFLKTLSYLTYPDLFILFKNESNYKRVFLWASRSSLFLVHKRLTWILLNWKLVTDLQRQRLEAAIGRLALREWSCTPLDFFFFPSFFPSSSQKCLLCFGLDVVCLGLYSYTEHESNVDGTFHVRTHFRRRKHLLVNVGGGCLLNSFFTFRGHNLNMKPASSYSASVSINANCNSEAPPQGLTDLYCRSITVCSDGKLLCSTFLFNRSVIFQVS